MCYFADCVVLPCSSVSGAVGARMTMAGYVFFAMAMGSFIYPVVSRRQSGVNLIDSVPKDQTGNEAQGV